MKLLLLLSVCIASCYNTRCPAPKPQDMVPYSYDYEYHFTVDGTDTSMLYTVYTNNGILIAEDIPACKIDSVINADNE